ncbi:MAG TPA: RNA methyltransferase [Nitrospiraceae bacterium]|nr:RNA methyltransferase [Nitrospiraceae bacterium]
MHKLAAVKAALIRDLVRHKKTRDAERLFIIEGPKPIEELLTSHPTSFQALVVTQASLTTADQSLVDRAKQSGCPIYVCQERVLATLSDLRTPSGMLAVVRQPVWKQEVVFQQPGLFGFYGECLQDPANVGPIIRTAVAFGLDAVWLSSDSADVFNPKVVRGTAGALLKLPIFYVPGVTLFSRFHCAMLTAELPSACTRPIQDIRTRPRRALVAFGNEGRGLSPSTLAQASIRFHIPIRSATDSLNVSAAAAIAAFALSALKQD